jgi:hypothetical protein
MDQIILHVFDEYTKSYYLITRNKSTGLVILDNYNSSAFHYVTELINIDIQVIDRLLDECFKYDGFEDMRVIINSIIKRLLNIKGRILCISSWENEWIKYVNELENEDILVTVNAVFKLSILMTQALSSMPNIK